LKEKQRNEGHGSGKKKKRRGKSRTEDFGRDYLLWPIRRQRGAQGRRAETLRGGKRRWTINDWGNLQETTLKIKKRREE